MKTTNFKLICRVLFEFIIIRLTDRMIFKITLSRTESGYDLKCFSIRNNIKYTIHIIEKP